jgi:hypothetical protein
VIVSRDFLGHWRTLLLCDLLGDKSAPLLLLRLWSHCESRKSDRFDDITPAVLKSICRYSGEADRLVAPAAGGVPRRVRRLQHDDLHIPAYGGTLFAPDRFPFLEGRKSGTTWKSDPALPLPVNNRTVLHLLEALHPPRQMRCGRWRVAVPVVG